MIICVFSKRMVAFICRCAGIIVLLCGELTFLNDMKKNRKSKRIKRVGLLMTFAAIVLVAQGGALLHRCKPDFTDLQAELAKQEHKTVFREVKCPTPNIGEGVNQVRGIILHHTAEPTAKRSVEILTGHEKQVSSHVVIDTDGTRYILAEPTQVTWHAGLSYLDGREGCNKFTVGIEFQGNTLEAPLTEDQIYSAIDYILPLMERYNIPVRNIVTHEYIRNEYIKRHPGKRVSTKPDITKAEYDHFMRIFHEVTGM